MGKNKISGIMKALTSGTSLESTEKRFTSHSMRKTTVKKVFTNHQLLKLLDIQTPKD